MAIYETYRSIEQTMYRLAENGHHNSRDDQRDQWSPPVLFIACGAVGMIIAVIGGYLIRGTWPDPLVIVGAVVGTAIGTWIIAKHENPIIVIGKRMMVLPAILAVVLGVTMTGRPSWLLFAVGLIVLAASILLWSRQVDA